jgi:hypothetical protein
MIYRGTVQAIPLCGIAHLTSKQLLGFITAKSEFEQVLPPPQSLLNMPSQPTHNPMYQQPNGQLYPAGSSDVHGG